MSIARHIELARQHLRAGNPGAYARSMSGGIRSALSTRAANRYRRAIAEDKAESFFRNLDSSCPTALEGWASGKIAQSRGGSDLPAISTAHLKLG
ncbi:hypothetical protein M2323_001438 [Rhodoblastus acidophilus]|uniref:hypothetical protein n=1 Tax=Rhodoblastus acidophilus TaxID=1074 RepID=UPI00222470AA|nr:hypothetical protein [Rhodoblastus acidophilus]MCW2283666.1 hypothetical protein [Rhodoblastus acidophilus]MCW2332526.1 hypothetical protein [Rhodoblastus acidophilus]